MKNLLFVALFLFYSMMLFSQQTENKYKESFSKAYTLYPQVPSGFLEAVAWNKTHIDNKTLNNTQQSCTGMPFGYGIFALVEDGKNWFNNNLITVSEISGISIDNIKNNVDSQIIAYAKAYSIIKSEMHIKSNDIVDNIPVLKQLSELHIDNNNINTDYAYNSFLYSVLMFLNDENEQTKYGFKNYNINLKEIFGNNNYQVLSAKKVQLTEHGVKSDQGIEFKSINAICPDYNVAWCSWVSSPNYSSRAGTPISVVVIHTVQGSYSSCINWFQNPSAQASTPYVVRSSDGQLTQMVLEADKAWHVGSENPYAIGYEHEGYVEQTGWYTMPMYQSSADLTRDICSRYGINTLRMFYRDTLDGGTVLDFDVHTLAGSTYCTKIAGHQHLPNQTHNDPGPYWVWDLYFKLVNNNPVVTTFNSASGTFFDTGGSTSNYGDDERKVWTIQPNGATNVTLNFTSFNVEADYDYMYIYDGASVWSPLIGRFNTQSPGTITSTGNSLTIEFRSDCSTNASGWVANWTSSSPDNVPPTTSVTTPNLWETQDFTATFTDADNIGVEKSLYQVIDFDGAYWGANTNNGFYCDNFDVLQPSWNVSTGLWNVNAGELNQTDEAENNSNIYSYLNQNLSNRYLYHFKAKVNSTIANRRFGFHFFSDSANYSNRNNSYFIWFRVDDQSLQFYKVQNDVFTLVNTIPSIVTNVGQYYDYKVSYDRTTGKICVWRDDVFLGSWVDSSPYSANGNYISFRTGNCSLSIGEIKVFRSRYPAVTVTMGDATKDIRYQNPNPTTYGAKIKSIVVDANNNLSLIDYHNLNIDWTPPSDVQVFDGTTIDVDTTVSNTSASVFWSSSFDVNSGIQNYYYSFGTSPGATDVIPWINNGLSTNASLSGLSLNQGIVYYFNVKSQNGAGLFSNITSSDGFIVSPTNIILKNEDNEINVYPNPNKGVFYINIGNKHNIKEISIETLEGKLISKIKMNNEQVEIKQNIQSGVYNIKFWEENGNFLIKKVVIF